MILVEGWSCVKIQKQSYPTGEKQEVITPKYESYFHWADVIADDYKIIGRSMPPPESGALKGKTIITNTLIAEDVENLRARGVKRIVTSTLEFDGRTFGTKRSGGDHHHPGKEETQGDVSE